MGENNYSGLCSGIFGNLAAELIFEDGRVVLVESAGNCGSKTLNEIHQNSDGAVTAELSAYNEAQLKLAREFNPKCSVGTDEFDALFSAMDEGEEPEEKGLVESTKESAAPETAPEEEEPEEFVINESEIQSVVSNCKSGAKELLRKINLDHLVIEEKSGEEDND